MHSRCSIASIWSRSSFPLPSHDWTPETLLLIDVLLGLLQGVMTCSNAEELLSSWARENEVLAAMVSSLVFDLRLLWERPWQCAELLSRAVALWAPQQAKEEAALCQAAQLLQVGLREQIFITGMRERSVRLRSECREELQKALSEGLAALTMWQGGGSLEQVTGLEMMYHLLRELPDLQNTLSETMEIKETITELEQLMHQRLLPGLYQLVEDDWGPRGRLADPELLRATQLLLRMALALRDISDVWEEEGSCHLVVRSTFLHMDDGQSLMQRYRKLRRAKTEFALERAMEDLEVYELGTAPRPHVAPLAPPTPTTAPVKTACGGVAEPGHRMSYRKERTTVMLRNLPNNYTREMFLEMLDSEGFRGSYDFVYLPCDFHRKANLGYAFVNMVDAWNCLGFVCLWAIQ
eukprot:g32394.t1